MAAKSRTRRVVIGERRLSIAGARKATVTVALGKPRRMRGGMDWECPFWIDGAGLAIHERGIGVDAIQALTSALEGIHVLLNGTGKPLSWMGLDATGFQRTVPFSLGASFSKRINRLIDREIDRHVRTLERRHARKTKRLT